MQKKQLKKDIYSLKGMYLKRNIENYWGEHSLWKLDKEQYKATPPAPK